MKSSSCPYSSLSALPIMFIDISIITKYLNNFSFLWSKPHIYIIPTIFCLFLQFDLRGPHSINLFQLHSITRSFSLACRQRQQYVQHVANLYEIIKLNLCLVNTRQHVHIFFTSYIYMSMFVVHVLSAVYKQKIRKGVKILLAAMQLLTTKVK